MKIQTVKKGKRLTPRILSQKLNPSDIFLRTLLFTILLVLSPGKEPLSVCRDLAALLILVKTSKG